MDLRESMRRVGRLGENGFLMEIHKIEVKKKTGIICLRKALILIISCILCKWTDKNNKCIWF